MAFQVTFIENMISIYWNSEVRPSGRPQKFAPSTRINAPPYQRCISPTEKTEVLSTVYSIL
jgi:hypothetical protein